MRLRNLQGKHSKEKHKIGSRGGNFERSTFSSGLLIADDDDDDDSYLFTKNIECM